MIISHSKKFVCLNPPKTGSGLREAIFDLHSDFDVNKVMSGKILSWPDGNYRHYNYCMTKDFFSKNNLNIEDYFVFTFVRNPWDVAVSWANMMLQQRGTSICKQLLVDAVNMSIQPYYKLISYYAISSQPLRKVDYIGSLETHAADIAKIGSILNLNLISDVSAYKTNRDPSHHKEISKFWDEELIELVRKEAAETIELMGYTFPG